MKTTEPVLSLLAAAGLLTFLVLAPLSVTPAAAQDPDEAIPGTLLIAASPPLHAFAQAPPCPAGPSDPAEMQRLLDPFFHTAMAQYHIPGAVISVVKDGHILFSKGYGYANLEKQTPVDPQRTLFRVASVSKLFVATAAMQLHERGELDLHADVNQYLRQFKIKPAFDKPITMANLLTHTGGFDDQIIGMAARTAEEGTPLGLYLSRRMPKRVHPPGEVMSYSNHGSALAGHIVEEIAGIPFADYVQQNILDPLAMNHSSFRLPAHLAPDIATSYYYDGIHYLPNPFDYLNPYPCGALNSTADDMAHFMIAHLQDGEYDGRRILQEASAQEMHRQQFTHHPALPGVCYGFYEGFRNGRRSLEHGGHWHGFVTELMILPREQVGVFVSLNAAQPQVNAMLIRLFMDHYYPEQSAPPAARTAGDLDPYTGYYRYTRYDRHTLCKFLSLYTQFHVTAPGGSALTVTLPNGRQLPGWEPVGHDLFYQPVLKENLAFRRNSHAQVTYLCIGPLAAFERMSVFDWVGFQWGLLQFFLVTFVAACALWPLRLASSKLKEDPSGAPIKPSPLPLTAEIAGWAVSAGNVFFIFFLLLALERPSAFQIVYGLPLNIKLLLCIPLLTGLTALQLPALGYAAWRTGEWKPIQTLQYTVVSAAAILFIPFLAYWNLIGFRT